MHNLLKQITQESINSYIEQNLDNFYIKSSTHSNFTSNLDNVIKWVYAKQADWPSCIFWANFENLNVESKIREIKSLIEENKAPNGWTVGPLTKPENLGKLLKENGFSNVYHQSGMAVELKNIIKLNKIPSNLEVEVVDNEKMLRQWMDTVSTVFDIKVDFELPKYLLSIEEPKFYIGYYNQKPVSTLLLYLSSGVAGLHAVSTLVKYRNKGFGLEISKTALIDAFKKGYRIGVLQASGLGERVYSKLGFIKYCDINTYAIEEPI